MPKATVEFELLTKPVMVMHEHVADGTYQGQPVELIRTIDSSAFYLTHRGKIYKIKTADLIIGVLEAHL